MNKMADTSRRWPTYQGRENIGAYEQPFSGVGVEFDPLGAPFVHAEFVLHEVGYWARNYDWNYPSVYSPFWRVYYDFEPGHAVQFGDLQTELGPDRLIVIPNHQRFDCLGDPPVPKLWLHFSCPWSIEPDSKIPIVIPVNDVLLALIGELPDLFQHPGPDRRIQIRRLGATLLTYLLGDSRIPHQRSIPEPIAEIIQRVNQRPGHGWKNPELAVIASMSTEGFIRQFKRWIGATPMRYVQQVRVREACRLLADTSATIDEIASQTGFADRFYFSRVFKQHTGRSPAAYRRQVGGATR